MSLFLGFTGGLRKQIETLHLRLEKLKLANAALKKGGFWFDYGSLNPNPAPHRKWLAQFGRVFRFLLVGLTGPLKKQIETLQSEIARFEKENEILSKNQQAKMLEQFFGPNPVKEMSFRSKGNSDAAMLSR
jgi:hypothetical protein